MEGGPERRPEGALQTDRRTDSLFYYLPNPFFRLRLTPNNAQMVAFRDILRAFRGEDAPGDRLSGALNQAMGTRNSVLTNSGRAALLLALRALGVKKGDEVVIPAVSCHSVADSVLQSGATPVLAEVRAADGTMDPGKLPGALSEKTKAVVALHYLGLPCDLREVKEVGDSRGVAVIGDCAQALGSKYEGENVATKTALSFFSFGADKHLCFGSGGMLSSNSPETTERVERVAPKVADGSGGVVYELMGRSLIHRDPVYGAGMIVKTPAIGLGYLTGGGETPFTLKGMSRVAANFGLRAIEGMEPSRKKRVENAKVLGEAVQKSRGVVGVAYGPRKEPVFLKYTVLTEGRSQRYRLMKALKRRGIEAGPLNWRYPLHKWGRYADWCERRVPLDGAEEFADRFLNLPCHPRVGSSDLAKMAEVLGRF